MNKDLTEAIRRQMAAGINTNPVGREALEAQYGKVWDTEQMKEEFAVIGFGMPLVVVRRRSDNVLGSLMFQANPRFYFLFEPHED